MNDAQAKKRGEAKKSVGRRGKNRLLMDNGLAQFDLMVRLKMTEIIRTRLLPNNKFLADDGIATLTHQGYCVLCA